ncbi:MAG TPA: EcsC family protein [Solimonas sp.]|nr:EcsC family protein [Solimonas sp.]
MTEYEQLQLEQLRRWELESPGWGTRLLAKPGSNAAKVVGAVVPVSALRASLHGLNDIAFRYSGREALLKTAGVDQLEELRGLPLEVCDALAKKVERRTMALAGAGGAVFGIVGAAGMVVDVPALLALALRSIQRTAMCYGEPGLDVAHKSMAIGIFALASANSRDEKTAALAALRSRGDLLDEAWRDGIERVAEREMAKEAAAFSLQTLASRIGLQLGRRKVMGIVPVLGAAVGASMNAWYIHDVSSVARHVFQERWLHAKYPRNKALAAPFKALTAVD